MVKIEWLHVVAVHVDTRFSGSVRHLPNQGMFAEEIAHAK
jgi:hypothetical protein